MTEGGSPTTTEGDIVYRGVSENERLPIGEEGQALIVQNGVPQWLGLATANSIYYVKADGNDDNDGTNLNQAFKTIRHAVDTVTGPATIYVKGGLYYEQLPLKVKANVTLVGDGQRNTGVAPINISSVGADVQATVSSATSTTILVANSGTTGNEWQIGAHVTGTSISGTVTITDIELDTPVADYTTLTVSFSSQVVTAESVTLTSNYSEGTMWQLNDGAMLNKMYFTGMTGWGPNLSYPEDITQSTFNDKGIFVALDPDHPIVNKSPYVIECAAFGTGAIGAVVDGDLHASGIKSMVFHGYTIVSSDGVGYWVNGQGKAEIVSCFTYYCWYGYTTTNGGKIRALNGNNSYGTYGVISRGYDPDETPVSGALYGEQIEYDAQSLTGGEFSVGNTITATPSGAIGVITNVQTAVNKIYYTVTSGTFTAADTISNGLGVSADIATGGVTGQKGFVLVADGFAEEPRPGGSLQLSGDTGSYIIQSVSGAYSNASSVLVLVLANEKVTASANNTTVNVRYAYSNARLTGHDFLSVGTGDKVSTNYPGEPTQPASQANEVVEAFPGRVFYVSTDQDGNFRVGDYFRVDQATGRATLNASAFDLSGLTSLRLGSIGAQLGELVNEFSSDYTMSGNSNEAVPTEQAVRNYFEVVATDIIPVDDNVQTLGTSSKRWNHVYVGPGSITLGSLTITDDAGTLTVTSSGTPAGVAIDAISNGTSNVSVAENSNVTVNAAGTLSATFTSTGATLEGDLQVKGGDLTTNQTTFNLVNTTATTVNLAGAGTTLSVGATSGTTTFNSTTTSTDADTGAVVVKGGLGVKKNVFFGGDLQVTGDIIFGGEANQLSATQLNIDDPMVYLAHDNLADILDLGILAAYNDGAHKHAGIVRDHTDNTWKFFTNLSVEPGNTVSWADVTYADGKMGGLTLTGDLSVAGGDITSSATTFNLLNTTVTTGNLFGAGTTIGVGATTGTLTVNNPTVVGSQTTVNLWNTTSTTVNFAGAATTLSIGAGTGTTTVNNDLNLASSKVYKVGSSTVLSKSALTLNGSSSGTVTFQAAAAAGSVTYTLPSADGSSGYALVTNGSGTLSWSVAGATITDDTSSTTLYPAMSSNNSGNFTSAKVTSTKLTFNASTGALAVKGSIAIQGSSSGAVTFAVPSAAGSVTYTLPSSDGTSGYALVTNGSGTLSWSAAGATIADDTSTTTLYPTMSTATSGAASSLKVSSTKMTFSASTGVLTTSGGFVESSSITLKENINPITNALDAVLQLVGVTYDRKDGSKKNETGLIAEAVAEVIPSLVSTSAEGKAEGIYYSKLTAYLVEAIKDLKSQIDPLKEEIRKLKGE
jgi:hypothetical protein